METNNRDMIETLLEASLSENYENTHEFMYDMAKKYRRVDQGRSVTSTISCLGQWLLTPQIWNRNRAQLRPPVQVSPNF